MRAMSRIFFLSLLLSSSLALADTAGGVTWTPPADWKAEPARPMRVATYKLAAAASDPEPAELAIFFFGAGQGGTVEDNIKRWAGQFEGGKPATTKKTKIGGLDVTRVELAGTFASSSMGPGGPSAPTKKPGFLLLGAIIEGGEGPIFWKLVGPKKTVEAHRKQLDKVLSTLKK
jgi:hypothetical protein